MINLFQPDVGAAELAAVADVFASDWLGNGPRSSEFEAAFGDYLGCGSREVLAIASCTEGLFQAIATLGVGPGDEVILPSVSFVGAANAVRATGARVVPCDVDPWRLNPTVAHVERALTPATRAIVVLHYGGLPGDVAEIARLARTRGVALVEDAALGIGGTAHEMPCGTVGDIGVWSFDAMKVITAGDGGMVWCRDIDRADRLRVTIRNGVASAGMARSQSTQRWWEIDPVAGGRRATLNDIAAAIGLVQLSRLPEILARRREVIRAYEQALSELPWLRLCPPRTTDAAPTFFWVQVDGDRDRFARHMVEHSVYVNFRYWPLHRMTLFRTTASMSGADSAADTTLLLPLHPRLSDRDVEQVVDAVMSYDARASR